MAVGQQDSRDFPVSGSLQDSCRLIAGINDNALLSAFRAQDIAAGLHHTDGEFIDDHGCYSSVRQKAFSLSRRMVTGPSLTRETFISVRKRPVST